ncbi:MAG: cysteine-rich CWC family protein [Chloroflexota bacterium]
MPENTNRKTHTTCPRCKAHFSCGVSAGDEKCWCFYFPRVMPLPPPDTSTECGCLCPDCLENQIVLTTANSVDND